MSGSPRSAAAADLLARGELRVLGLLPRASNYTFLAEVRDADHRALAVYKPRAGETPLWDFPEGTLCNREVAASLVAEALGWPAVPPTVLRDGPHGEGSVQLYIDANPHDHYFTLRDTRLADFRPVAAFDVIVGNGDRKAGHVLVDAEGTLWSVDHGLCFHPTPWLRTVIWDFAGEPLPDALALDVRRVAGELGYGALRESLLPVLDVEEIDATAARAEELAGSGTYPVPGPRRSHPWPAV